MITQIGNHYLEHDSSIQQLDSATVTISHEKSHQQVAIYSR